MTKTRTNGEQSKAPGLVLKFESGGAREM